MITNQKNCKCNCNCKNDNNNETPRLLSTKQVLRITGLASINTLKKRIKDDGFPSPIIENRRLYWDRQEVNDWLDVYISKKKQLKT